MSFPLNFLTVICCVVFQESVLNATRRCMEPTRPAKLWVASTTTAASPAVPVVSTYTALTIFLQFEHFALLVSVDSHVKSPSD